MLGKRGECHCIGLGDESNKTRICAAVCAAPASVLFFVSSSMPSICFGSCIALQQLSAPLSPTPSALLTAETYKCHDVGTNYVIKLK